MTDAAQSPGAVAVTHSRETPHVVIGVVRNGRLTHEETREHFELEGMDGRRFVTVLLPYDRTFGMTVFEQAIGAIRGVISQLQSRSG